MKNRYKILLGILATLLIIFEAAVILGGLNSARWLPHALQGAGVFVALIAAVIALHSSDKEPQDAEVEIAQVQADPKPITHEKEKTKETIWKALGHDKSPFKSARVHFRLVNRSGLSLRRPTLSFRLPLDRRHPHRFEDGSFAVTFNSNLYNSQENLRSLQFGQTAIISNSNLPFWNDGDELVIWIRMAIDAPNSGPFNVQVSVNAENARGLTYALVVEPDSILV